MDWTSKKGQDLLAEAYGEKSPPTDSLKVTDIAGFSLLKLTLSLAVNWPYLPNLSWFQLWPGGWCLHGRAAVATPQDAQQSMTFEIAGEVTDPIEALVRATAKVKAHPERLDEKVRWYCQEHGWEEIMPRGHIRAGCPKCGAYYCEPYPPLGEED